MTESKLATIPENMHLPLQQSAAHNHIELFKVNALSNGGEVREKDGVLWMWHGGKGNIAFPHFTKENATALIDEIMAYYREKKAANIGCWSLHPVPYRPMSVKLLARGFQPGWQPNWMAIDLNCINTNYARPEGLEIIADNEIDTSPLKDLPYSGDGGAVSRKAFSTHPQMAQRFIAKLNGEIVGQSCAFITGGEQPTAGLYEVGVVPAARNKGIGRAVVAAACQHAKSRGLSYATLNGTGKEMYEAVGFQQIGFGRTWWITGENRLANPPSRKQVGMAEAVGFGKIDMLEKVGQYFTAEELNAPMANGLRFIQLAAYAGKPQSGEWLVNHGATYTALDAWSLGWKERTDMLLAANPQEVNRRYDEGGLTLLHIAAQKGDFALAKLAMAHNPDLNILDKWHDSTAQGWAWYFKRKDIFELIESHKTVQPGNHNTNN